MRSGSPCCTQRWPRGPRAILVDSSFSPAPLLRALEARDATVLHGSPTLFRTLLKARPDGLPGIRTGLVAGAPCPSDLLEALDERGTRILNCYGLSETGAVHLLSGSTTRPFSATRPSAGPAPAYEARVDRRRARSARASTSRPATTAGRTKRPRPSATAGSAPAISPRSRTATSASSAARRRSSTSAASTSCPPRSRRLLLAHPDVANAAVLGVPDERMGEALARLRLAAAGRRARARPT